MAKRRGIAVDDHPSGDEQEHRRQQSSLPGRARVRVDGCRCAASPGRGRRCRRRRRPARRSVRTRAARSRDGGAPRAFDPGFTARQCHSHDERQGGHRFRHSDRVGGRDHALSARAFGLARAAIIADCATTSPELAPLSREAHRATFRSATKADRADRSRQQEGRHARVGALQPRHARAPRPARHRHDRVDGRERAGTARPPLSHRSARW